MTPRRQWTEADVDVLKQQYAETPTATIAQQLGRSVRQVYAKAGVMGLRKSAAFQCDPVRSGRTDGSIGKAGRFKPGHQTWNKGTHFKSGGRSVETQFKPGQKPHTWRPVGYVRVTKDGYLERKMTDTGVTRRDFRPVHHLLWIEAGNTIPAGHALVFKNGDKLDIRLENLELVTRAELMLRNTFRRLPPEIQEVIRLRGTIRTVITKKLKKEASREHTE